MSTEAHLKLVKQKDKHFLRQWDKLKSGDINRLLVILLIALPFLGFFYLLVLFCIVVYLLSYLIFKSYEEIGTITLTHNTITLNIEGAKTEIDVDSISKLWLSYKFMGSRISNRNKQTLHNSIYLVSADKTFQFNYIFNKKKDFFDLEDLFDGEFNKRKDFELISLDELEMNDLIALTSSRNDTSQKPKQDI